MKKLIKAIATSTAKFAHFVIGPCMVTTTLVVMVMLHVGTVTYFNVRMKRYSDYERRIATIENQQIQDGQDIGFLLQNDSTPTEYMAP